MDPLKVIRHFTGCLLHPTKSKLDSLELGVVWKYIMKLNLNGAHDSLVDAKAQSDIILHQFFVPYINKGFSIQPITDIFTKTETREWKKEMEPIRPVHSPWVEITRERNIKWEPEKNDDYLGSEGGAPAGPSSAALLVASTTGSSRQSSNTNVERG